MSVVQGDSCSLVRTCKICGKTKYYYNFKKKSGTKTKIHKRQSHCLECAEIAYQMRVKNRPYTKANEICEKLKRNEYVETIPFSPFQKEDGLYFQYYKSGTKIDYTEEMLNRYISEGSCEVVKDYPYIVVFHYPTKYERIKPMILERDKNVCFYCGKYGNTVDHLIPQTMGGLSTPKNCVCACDKCNFEKADMTYDEYLIYKKRKETPVYNKNGIKIEYNPKGKSKTWY